MYVICYMYVAYCLNPFFHQEETWILTFNMATVCPREQRNETSAMYIPAKHKPNHLLSDMRWVSVSLLCFERKGNAANATLSSLLKFRQVALTIPFSFCLLPTVRLRALTQREANQHCIIRGSFQRAQETSSH